MRMIDDFERAKKAYFRGGNFLEKVFDKDEMLLSGEEMMSLFNTYGIPPYELALMCYSHSFDFDKEGFEKLLNEQKERSKNMKQCDCK